MKKYLSIFTMLFISILLLSCQKESITDDTPESTSEAIQKSTLQELPNPVRSQLEAYLKNEQGAFGFFNNQVTLIISETGVKTYSIDLKQNVDIQSIMKVPEVAAHIKNDCKKPLGLGADMVTHQTILVNVKNDVVGTPVHVFSVNQGDIIKTTFTDIRTGNSFLGWVPNVYAPSFTGNHSTGNTGGGFRKIGDFFGNIFNSNALWVRKLKGKVGALFKRKRCGCRGAMFVLGAHSTDEDLDDCCDDDSFDPDFGESNFILPIDFLEAEVKMPNLSDADCDCFLKKYHRELKFVLEDIYTLEDKMAIKCACAQNNIDVFSLVLGLTEAEETFLKTQTQLQSDICDFLSLNNYDDTSILFVKEAVKTLKNGGQVYFSERIIDNISSKYKCAKDILKLLPNLKNDIASILKETFDNNAEFCLIFKNDTLGNIDGITKIENKHQIIEIILNSEILETATNEYILVTMYHEVIHAYLNVQKSKLGSSEFEKRYPDTYIHNTLGMYKGKAYSKIQFLISSPTKKGDNHFKFEQYINKLTEAVLSYNPKMSRQVAQSMAKMGIIRPNDLFDWEIQLNQNEREGNQFSQGKKCK